MNQEEAACDKITKEIRINTKGKVRIFKRIFKEEEFNRKHTQLNEANEELVAHSSLTKQLNDRILCSCETERLLNIQIFFLMTFNNSIKTFTSHQLFLKRSCRNVHHQLIMTAEQELTVSLIVRRGSKLRSAASLLAATEFLKRKNLSFFKEEF